MRIAAEQQGVGWGAAASPQQVWIVTTRLSASASALASLGQMHLPAW